MGETQITNLDIRCAELGRQLADIRGMEEKVINAALTVLEEQGPYAMFLYLKARHSEMAGSISKEAMNFLSSIFPGQVGNAKDARDAVKNLADDLDALLFARELLRTAFSYARYHLKAKEGRSS